MKSTTLAPIFFALALVCPMAARASDAATIDRQVAKATQILYAGNPKARNLASRAKAVLVFPNIIKAGFLVGGLYGEGAMRERGHTIGYYNTAAASYGLQAGVTEYGYALIFMDDESLAYLKRSKGWSIGAGPSVTLVDEGINKSMNTNSIQKGVYAFFFNQKGLMGGMSLEGSKITRIHPD